MNQNKFENEKNLKIDSEGFSLLEMSNISYAAYLSELYNLRNMIKSHSIELGDIEIKITELQNKVPEGLKPIDVWEDGNGEHGKMYSADVVYQKVESMIKEIEEIKEKEIMGFDEIVQKIDALTELNSAQSEILNDHTKKLNSISSAITDTGLIIENSVLPSLKRIEEKIDKSNQYHETALLDLAEIKSQNNSVSTHILATQNTAEANFTKLASLMATTETINSNVKEILSILKTNGK